MVSLRDICAYLFPFFYPPPDFTVLLPAPPGPYSPASRQIQLFDPSRPTYPFSLTTTPNASASTPPRPISLKIFFPSGPQTTYPPPYLHKYLGQSTCEFFDSQFPFLQDTIHEGARIDTPCRDQGTMLKHDLDGKKEAFPLLLFSAGNGVMRFMYTNIALALASRGYIVVVMDYVGETVVEILEDGKMIYPSGLKVEEQEKEKEKGRAFGGEGPEDVEKALEMRVGDARFALDELERMRLFPKIREGHSAKKAEEQGGLDGRKVGILGHGLGGVTAAATIRQDARFSAGASMDGVFPKEVASHISGGGSGGVRPFLTMKSEHSSSSLDAESATFWENTSGFSKKQIAIESAKHMDWTDYPMLWEEMGVWDRVPEEMREGHGTIEPKRMLEIQAAYLGAFFDSALKGSGEDLFERRDEEFPEVKIVR